MKDERHETIEQSVTDCNHLGNAAKMREALEKIASMGEQIDYQLGSSEETVYALRHERCLAHNISECARSALSATPRNCDLYRTKKEWDEAYKKYREHVVMSNSNPYIAQDEMMSKEEWLCAEAKAEEK